jgi:hypothetical protein
MKICCEACANVLNPTTNVKQFMAELNHNTGSTFNMKSYRAKCRNFSHMIILLNVIFSLIKQMLLSSLFQYWNLPTSPRQSLKYLDSGHNPASHRVEQHCIRNYASVQVVCSRYKHPAISWHRQDNILICRHDVTRKT